MAKAYQRIIQKPSGLSDSDAAKLTKGLSDAIEAQRAFASKSPHILQLIGELQQDERTFIIEHEPADPLLQASTLFDPTAPKDEPEKLMQMAAVFADGLRAVIEGFEQLQFEVV